MRSTRIAVGAIAVALAATACGGSSKVVPSVLNTPAVAPTSATPTSAAPTDSAPTDSATPTDSAAPTDSAPTDSAPTDSAAPTDGSAPTLDPATDPGLLGAADVPAGFATSAPDAPEAVGAPGVCNVPSDGDPGATSRQEVDFVKGTGADQELIAEQLIVFPDAATAQARLAKGLADAACSTYTDDKGAAVVVTATSGGPTEVAISLDQTKGSEHLSAGGEAFTVGPKLYYVTVLRLADEDTDLGGDMIIKAQSKAGYM